MTLSSYLDSKVTGELDHLGPVVLGLFSGLFGLPDGGHSGVVGADLLLSLVVGIPPEGLKRICLTVFISRKFDCVDILKLLIQHIL